MLLASLLAFDWSWLSAPIQPIIRTLKALLLGIDGVTHNIGASLVILAAMIALALWPLRYKQFKSAAAMQKIAPELKALQARYKSDPTKLNEATMALYKDRGVNPLASCFPLLIQMPVLFSVYWAITGDKQLFGEGSFLWIGSSLTHAVPFLGKSLAEPDYLLLGMYIVSMYFSFKLTAPPADPQQAQQQQMMAFISPAMIGFFAIQNHWPSALVVYWLSANLFTMGQQFLANRQRKRSELTEASKLPAAPVVAEPAIRTGKRVRAVAPLPPSAKRSGAAGSGLATAADAGAGTAAGNGLAKKNGNGAKPGAAKPGSGTNAAAKRRR